MFNPIDDVSQRQAAHKFNFVAKFVKKSVKTLLHRNSQWHKSVCLLEKLY